jgi:hypothetical protein
MKKIVLILITLISLISCDKVTPSYKYNVSGYMLVTKRNTFSFLPEPPSKKKRKVSIYANSIMKTDRECVLIKTYNGNVFKILAPYRIDTLINFKK